MDMSQLLHNISPPLLKLRGPGNIIKALQDQTLSGKSVKIEGLLYFGDGILQATSETVEKISHKIMQGVDSLVFSVIANLEKDIPLTSSLPANINPKIKPTDNSP